MFSYNQDQMQFSAPLNLPRLSVVAAKQISVPSTVRDMHVAVTDLKSSVEISASGVSIFVKRGGQFLTAVI